MSQNYKLRLIRQGDRLCVAGAAGFLFIASVVAVANLLL